RGAVGLPARLEAVERLAQDRLLDREADPDVPLAPRAEGDTGRDPHAKIPDESLAEPHRVGQAIEPGKDVEGPRRDDELHALNPPETFNGDVAMPGIACLAFGEERLAFHER